MTDLEEVVVGNDEIEAMRLKNLVGLSQGEAAGQMSISQPTLHRLLSSAYAKITDAIVNGKSLRIEGGNISMQEASLPACGHGRICRGGRRGMTKRSTRMQQQNQGGPMKIAITSRDGTMEGVIDERFGRAKKILVYDLDANTFEVVENGTQMNFAQGAGIQTGQNVVNLGVKSVISGHLGPNAFRVLQAAGIEAYSATGMSVTDAVKKYRDGTLTKLSGADVEGHW
jgi:predicted Fe-Mo cluster-binding NifX family protein/predicted DNA-binding protein (UPF0251 family)